MPRNEVVTLGGISSFGIKIIAPTKLTFALEDSQALKNEIGKISLERVVISIEGFRTERQTGYGLQLAGLLLSAGGAVLLASDPTQSKTSATLVAGGTVLSLAGFIITFDAGKHLRIR